MEYLLSKLLQHVATSLPEVNLVDEDYGQLENLDQSDRQMYPLVYPAVLIEPSELERKIGASQSTLSKAYKGKKDIQAQWLTAIATLYLKYSGSWILTGESPIYKDNKYHDLHIDGGGHVIANSNGSAIMLPSSNASSLHSIELLESLLLTREEQVKKLIAMLKSLQDTNTALTQSIVNSHE